MEIEAAGVSGSGVGQTLQDLAILFHHARHRFQLLCPRGVVFGCLLKFRPKGFVATVFGFCLFFHLDSPF